MTKEEFAKLQVGDHIRSINTIKITEIVNYESSYGNTAYKGDYLDTTGKGIAYNPDAWTKLNYIEEQDRHHLKVGDWVKVTRKADSYEGGWGTWWNDSLMDQAVGKVYIISNIASNPRNGYRLFKEDDTNVYPHFILEKVDPNDYFKTNEELHRAMWSEIYVKQLPNKREVSLFKKYDPTNRCFACEESMIRYQKATGKNATQARCKYCPIVWSVKQNNPMEDEDASAYCERESDSVYQTWVNAESSSLPALNAARKIAQIKWNEFIAPMKQTAKAPKVSETVESPNLPTYEEGGLRYTLLRRISSNTLEEAGACEEERDKAIELIKESTDGATDSICTTCMSCRVIYFLRFMKELIDEGRYSWIEWGIEQGFLKREVITREKVIPEAPKPVKKTPKFYAGEFVKIKNIGYEFGIHTDEEAGKIFEVVGVSTDTGTYNAVYKLKNSPYTWPETALEFWRGKPESPIVEKPKNDGKVWEYKDREQVCSLVTTLCRVLATQLGRTPEAIAWRAVRILRDEFNVDLNKLSKE